jgi:replication fork protection complex subunit Tof1/Swi1
LLFSKIPPTIYYIQHGEDQAPAQPKRPRAAAELEVRPGRSREDQIAVVVAALLDDQKSEALDMIKTLFANTISEMRSWELSAEARRIVNGEDTENENPRRQSTSIYAFHTLTDLALIFGTENLRTAVFKDGKLQLLLKLMGAQRIGERGRLSETSTDSR